MAQEGLIGADFFRFLPDASYLSGLGFETSMEVDAGVVVDDPVTLSLLPDPRPDVQVLAAELELADRLHSSIWDADLSEPIFGVTQLEL